MDNQNPIPQPTPYQTQPQPYPQNNAGYEDTTPLSIGSYLIMMIVSVIPIVGFIMLFVWGFGNSNLNKKNWARAQLILLAISTVLFFIFGAALIASIANMMGPTY
ncbi:MAG: hypothetical protein LKJ17_08575 [Oscillospiraceae bacterium]|jgi:hypothetical protein|nr:hypothetical protein [Oscillospiraceae bacterium]